MDLKDFAIEFNGPGEALAIKDALSAQGYRVFPGCGSGSPDTKYIVDISTPSEDETIYGTSGRSSLYGRPTTVVTYDEFMKAVEELVPCN